MTTPADFKAKETRLDNQGRKRSKIDLTKRLYEKGYQREDIINLFRFIDWVMRLPEELENSFWQEVTQYEEEKKMPYITSVETRGIEQGLQQRKRGGLIQGIEMILEFKFGRDGLIILPEISQIQDVEMLKTILNSIKTVNTLEELRQIYQ
ncbi:MAG: hypothetical protein RMX35_08330 [Nostoc sp. DcaGUA01]|nr:hypothetical protein [Nostoc sp. DcaGUA01]